MGADSRAAAFASAAPRVRLVNTFAQPFDNAVATARTCYSKRVVSAEEVSRDERARALRDRIARETYQAGHHTTLQHATFQFTLENVSRQLVWSLLHAHPFYNSEQVSQRYVEVAPGNVVVPALPPAEEALYRGAVGRMMECYRRLVEVLTPEVEAEYGRLFPARRPKPGAPGTGAAGWASAIQKRAQEIARYALPVGTFTHLYHTVSGLTLYRYHRLCSLYDVPREAAEVVAQMVEEARRADPLFFRQLEDPLPLEQTPEHALLVRSRRELDPVAAREFVREFDGSLEGRRSKLVDWSQRAEAVLADSVRSVLGLTRDRLTDDAAIEAVLSPKSNRYLGEALKLTTLSKLSRALAHPHYVFRKKLSHSADSQDQRHRTVPASRPILAAHYAGGEPDLVVPDLIERCGPARELFLAEMGRSFADIDRLLAAGVSAEDALYLLPNAFPVRYEESGELLYLHHKWTTRLCYTAQEEIWRASRDEVEQVLQVHPRIGAHLVPPCQLRDRAGLRPLCPEGPRYCGVPVWRVPLGRMERVL